MYKNAYIDFLDKMESIDPVVESAKKLYKNIFEHQFFKPLTVPDSIRQNSVFMDYKGMTKMVPTANGTSAPDNLGVDELQNTNHRCTRDTGEETRDSQWSVPKFKKATVSSSLPIKQLIERAKNHLPNPMVMGAPYGSAQPAVGAMTIASNWSNPYKPGVYVGGSDGGSGATSGGGGGNAS